MAALRNGEITTGAELARRFGATVRDRYADAPARWLGEARAGPLAGSAERLGRDRARRFCCKRPSET